MHGDRRCVETADYLLHKSALTAGSVGRLLTSARMFQNDIKVLTFCRLAGMVEGRISAAGWRFFLQMLHCIKTLQEDAWQNLVQVCAMCNSLVILLTVCLMS